jgi:hypothetical protein
MSAVSLGLSFITGTLLMLHATAVLVTALLFGGMVLFSFGFPAFVFKALPNEMAGPTIRQAFPPFYVFVMVTALVGALLLWSIDPSSALLMGIIVLSTLPTRQLLMPAINRATDAGQKATFTKLHKLSVFVTLSHLVLTATVLVRLTST